MIALTGYTGFIGKILLAELLKLDECLLLGRSKPNDDTHFCELNLESINKPALLESLKGVSTFIHLAGRAHTVDETAVTPLAEFRTVNTLATAELAKLAAEAGVKRFIYISTIKVNGESTSNKAPFTNDDLLAPKDDYGTSKAEAEYQLTIIAEQTQMEIVIIRPPLVYGEGVKANFASLMTLVAKGIPLPFRLIKNKRSLVSVYNLVDLIVLCITHPKAANHIFLVSDDDDLSTAQIIALMAEAQGKVNLALPIPMWCFALAGNLFNKADVVEKLTDSLQLDISFTKNTLNWRPPFSVKHGFRLAAKSPSEKQVTN
jgi:nucleoside-diphosphate-sugar epimerase